MKHVINTLNQKMKAKTQQSEHIGELLLEIQKRAKIARSLAEQKGYMRHVYYEDGIIDCAAEITKFIRASNSQLEIKLATK